jgi:hypothetical protein
MASAQADTRTHAVTAGETIYNPHGAHVERHGSHVQDCVRVAFPQCGGH